MSLGNYMNSERVTRVVEFAVGIRCCCCEFTLCESLFMSRFQLCTLPPSLASGLPVVVVVVVFAAVAFKVLTTTNQE